MNMAVRNPDDRRRRAELGNRDLTTVSAICNRVSRMLGLTDRDGLQEDLAIVQSHCPLDLEALLASRDKVFIEELLSIVDSTDRATGTLKPGFESRFASDGLGLGLL